MIEADGYRDTRRHLIDGHSVQQARDMYVCYDVSITSLLEATYHRELCWLLGFSRVAKARTVHEPWEMSHEPWEATSHEPLSHEKPWATNLAKPWATNLGKPRATSHGFLIGRSNVYTYVCNDGSAAILVSLSMLKLFMIEDHTCKVWWVGLSLLQCPDDSGSWWQFT